MLISIGFITNPILWVIFLVAHPDDIAYSIIIQCFKRLYHKDDSHYKFSYQFHLGQLPLTVNTHHHQSQSVIPYHYWISNHDEENFLIGSFDVLSLYGKQSKDYICSKQWQALSEYSHKFGNEIMILSSLHLRSYYWYTIPFDTS